MNDNDRQQLADDIAEGFTRLANDIGHSDPRRTNLAGAHEGDDMTPIQRMRFGFQGWPKAARYDGDSASSSSRERDPDEDGWRLGRSDPTGNAAIVPDRAAHDLKTLDRLLRDAEKLQDAISALLSTYGPARAAGDAERALVARENIKPEPGCSNCGKHGHWQPIDPRRPNLAICRFCAEWRIATGVHPGKRECDMHNDGKTVRRPDANHVARRKGTAA